MEPTAHPERSEAESKGQKVPAALVSAAFLFLLLSATGCATVKNNWTEPDYDSTDRTQVKRLVVLTSPFPDGSKEVASLFDHIAQDYVNLHRNFLAKATAYGPAPEGAFAPAALCSSMQEDQIEGVLWLAPTARRDGGDVAETVDAKLLRCSDQKTIWSAQAKGTWSSEDSTIKEQVQLYQSQIDPSVGPYVAPTFRLLKAALDTLPDPTLTDADKDEKIAL
jgi:probable lipoprotein (TIGR04455 family)